MSGEDIAGQLGLDGVGGVLALASFSCCVRVTMNLATNHAGFTALMMWTTTREGFACDCEDGAGRHGLKGHECITVVQIMT